VRAHGPPRRAQSDPRAPAAGALLPPDAADPDAEPVFARRHRHPALGERVVVRLTPASLVEVEDAALGALGFTHDEALASPVAAQLAAAEFGARALRGLAAQDPTRRPLLRAAVLLQIAGRLAGDQPEAAWARLEEGAQGLARAAPAWLPDFWEEGARRALAAAQLPVATRAFHRARDAQRALPRGGALEREGRAYLEFTLEGALNIRDLETWAADLEQRAPPQEAFALFRALCAQRTLRGAPPWGTMIAELRHLARAAGLRPLMEERRLLREIIEAGALVRAPAAFWSDCRRAVIALGRQEPRLRLALLRLLPGWGERRAYFAAWLRLLGECGALDVVTLPPEQLSAELRLPRHAALWWERALAHMTGGWRGESVPVVFFEALRRAAPRLRREGVPLDLCPHGQFDPDLVDLALELRLPIIAPAPRVRCDLRRWASPQEHSPERPRALTWLVRAAPFEPLLARALAEAADDLAVAGRMEQAPDLKKLSKY
jgi:hypothetical protein